MTNINELFAIEAEELLNSGKIDQAIQLCEKGLEKYPNYSTAYTILAQAYAKKRNSEDKITAIMDNIRKSSISNHGAEKVIASIYEYLKNSEFVEEDSDNENNINETNEKEADVVDDKSDTLGYEEVEEISSIQDTHTKLIDLFSDNFHLENNLKIKFKREFMGSEDALLKYYDKNFNCERLSIPLPKKDDLSILAESLSSSKIAILDGDFPEDVRFDTPAIVTDTIAELLAKQGSLKAAKEVYQKLLKLNPDKEEFYLSKINSL